MTGEHVTQNERQSVNWSLFTFNVGHCPTQIWLDEIQYERLT